MVLESLHNHACKTYLLADEEDGFAAFVDPVLEHFNEYLDLVRKRKLTLTHVIDTHTHADHISAGAALKDATRCAYVMHENAASTCVNEPVRDGDVIRVGKLRIHVMFMPGHSSDSLCLKVGHALFTGDVLFLDEAGAGRDDLPGGDAGLHWESLQKFSALPDNLMIYPSHEYKGRPPSTLGHQRHVNPHLQPRGRDSFIGYTNSLLLKPSDRICEAIPANRACAMDPRTAWIPADLPGCEIGCPVGLNVNTLPISEIDPASFRQMMQLWKGIQDRRGKEHMPDESRDRWDNMPDESRDMMDKEHMPDESRDMREKPVSGKSGGAGNKKAAPGAWLLLDVREPAELDGPDGQLEGVSNIPIGQLGRRLGDLLPYETRQIIVICRSGSRSATAARILAASGFANVKVLGGGMHDLNRLPEKANAR